MNIIAGMHRSGTSFVARLMHEAGADFGDPETFYPADKWNPDGYFEQKAIHAVNMPLINGPFWKFAYFHLPSAGTIARRAAKFSDEIRRLSDAYRDTFVKENRFCLTLGAWRAQGAQVDRLVVCLREPYDVARSVQRRNRTTLKRGYRLWHTHHARLMESSADLAQWYVSFPSLMAPDTFEQEASGLLQFCGIDHDADTLAHLRGLIRTPKSESVQTGNYDYPADVAQLWEELCARHAAQDNHTRPAKPARAGSV